MSECRLCELASFVRARGILERDALVVHLLSSLLFKYCPCWCIVFLCLFYSAAQGSSVSAGAVQLYKPVVEDISSPDSTAEDGLTIDEDAIASVEESEEVE